MFKQLILFLIGIVTVFASVISAADVIDGEDLVDPTRPFFLDISAGNDSEVAELYRTVVPASFDISFIRAGNSSPMAVVNNQRVTVGDEIGGAEVVGIDRNGVTLLINDEEQRFTLFGTSVKTSTSN